MPEAHMTASEVDGEAVEIERIACKSSHHVMLFLNNGFYQPRDMLAYHLYNSTLQNLFRSCMIPPGSEGRDALRLYRYISFNLEFVHSLVTSSLRKLC